VFFYLSININQKAINSDNQNIGEKAPVEKRLWVGLAHNNYVFLQSVPVFVKFRVFYLIKL
jgi:hypothetical protein